jgi:hypothetical protein
MNRLPRVLVVVLSLMMLFGWASNLPEQAWAGKLSGSVTLTIKNCPAKMTRDTLKEEECETAAGDVAVKLTFDRGTRTLTLKDATVDGDAYVWSGLPIAPSRGTGLGDPYVYQIIETRLPQGFTDYVVAGANALGAHDLLPTTFLFRLDVEQPEIDLTIYNFTKRPPKIEPATVTMYVATCPPGYKGDTHEAYETTCEPTPTVGATFRAARLGEKVRFGHVFDLDKTGEDGLIHLTAVRSLRQGAIYIGEDLIYPLDNIAETVVVCVDEHDERIDVKPIKTGVVELPLKPGDTIRCDWFNIPTIEATPN